MRFISKLTLFLIMMATSCELCNADVTVPDGTRSHYEHQDYNRNDLYKVGSIHLGDTSGNTMEVAAPDLADDNTVFKFPATNGTDGYSLFTDGSGNTSWGAVLTPDAIPAAGVVKSDGTDLTSGDVDLESEVTGVLPKANGGAGADISAITFPASGTLATEAYVDAVGLGDLSDVDTSGANNCDALVYDESESKWVPGAVGGAGLGAVNFNTNPNATAGVDLGDANDIGDYVSSGSGVTVAQATTGLPMGSLRATGIQLTFAAGTGDYVRLRFRVPETYRGMINQIVWRQALDSFVAGTAKVELYSYSDAYANGETQVNLLHRDSNGESLIKNAPEFYEEFLADATREYYELRIVNDGATAGTLTLNDVVIGPDTRINGAVVSEWESFTPSFNNNTGHAATVVAYKRRVGDNLEINFTYTLGGDGDAGSTFTMNLPDSLNLAMTDVTLGTGYLTIEEGTTDYYSAVTAIYPSSGTSTIRFISENPSGLKQRVLEQEDFGTSSARIRFLAINMSIPIAEWRGKGTTQMLTQGHLYANAKFRVVSDSTATVGNNATVTSQWNTVQWNDVNATFSSGLYTVKADGKYRVTAQLNGTGATSVQLFVRKNGSSNVAAGPLMSETGFVSAVVDLLAGDTLSILRAGGGTLTLSGSTLTNYFEIERISDYTHGTGVGLGLATAENPGLVTTEAQTWAGNKVFEDNVTLNSGIILDYENEHAISAGTHTIDVTGKNFFILGNATATINNFSNGVSGQVIYIIMVSSGANLTLVDSNSTGGDPIRIDGGNRNYTGYGAIMLIRRNANWFILQGSAH